MLDVYERKTKSINVLHEILGHLVRSDPAGIIKLGDFLTLNIQLMTLETLDTTYL